VRLLAPAEPSVSRPQDRRKITVRLNGIQAAITVVFAVLALAFWYFQVVQHAKFRELAENNHQRTLSLRAPRGVLYDRHGAVLVENRDSFVISLVREHIKDADETIRLLCRVAQLDEAAVRETVRRNRNLPAYRPIRWSRTPRSRRWRP